jgi:hypothetical protein
VPIKHSHARYDALLFDQRDVVRDGQQVAENRRNGKSARDAIGDGIGAISGYDRSCSPGHGHGGRTSWLDAYDFCRLRQGLENVTHTGGQSASAKREQNCIDAIEPVEELEADCARAFTGVEVFAVLHEKRVAVGRDLSGTLTCILNVSLDQFDWRA